MNGDPRDVPVADFAFPSMQAGSHLEIETAQRMDDGAGAMNCARRAIEVSEEAVAGGVDLVSAKPGELATHESVMLAE